MKLEITTPAVLFTSISLLISAYTSRFLSLAQLLRQLDNQYQKEKDEHLLHQIRNLSKRVSLIRYSQIMGGLSFLLCTLSTFLLFRNLEGAGEFFFGASLVSLMGSIFFLLIEVQISVKALNLQLKDYEHDLEVKKKINKGR